MRQILVAALLMLLAGPALAMQNIKCIPLDRKLLSTLAEEAGPVLDTGLKTQLERTAAGEAPSETWVTTLDPFLERSNALAERAAGDDVKTAWGKVNRKLTTLIQTVKEARDAETARPALLNLQKLAKKDILPREE